MNNFETVSNKLSVIQKIIGKVGDSMGWQGQIEGKNKEEREKKKEELKQKFKKVLEAFPEEVLNAIYDTTLCRNTPTYYSREFNLDTGDFYYIMKQASRISTHIFNDIDYKPKLKGEWAVMIFYHPNPLEVNKSLQELAKKYDENFQEAKNDGGIIFGLKTGKEKMIVIIKNENL